MIFLHKATAYYVLFQDSAKWVSAKRDSANREDTGNGFSGNLMKLVPSNVGF